ncbi:MAG: cytochrome b [Micropepsaceae bacterium]
MSTNSPSRYDTVAMTLHWLIALAIIAMLVIGKIMVDLPRDDPDRFFLYQTHKSTGFVILTLTVLRIAWRLTHTMPPLPVHMARWEQIAAKATHGILYFMMIAIPLTGWAVVSSSTSGIPTLWYGLFEVPNLPGIPSDHDTHEQAEEMHEILGNLTILLLILHVGAALKHHVWDKDDVLKRMLPFFR